MRSPSTLSYLVGAGGLLAGSVEASRMYSSGLFTGSVNSLELNKADSSITVLQRLDSNPCGSEAYISYDAEKEVLYCFGTGYWASGMPGTIATFNTTEDGTMTKIDSIEVPCFAQGATQYGADGRGLAIPCFEESDQNKKKTTFHAVTTDAEGGNLKLIMSEDYASSDKDMRPTNNTRQQLPHLRDSVADPTGKFLVTLDYGADLLRLHQIGGEGAEDWDYGLTALEPVSLPRGTGPTSAVFKTSEEDDKTYLYVANEIGQSVTGFEVSYDGQDATPSFTEIFTFSSYGEGVEAPVNSTATQITISPDGNFLLLGIQNDQSHKMQDWVDTEWTIKSDPIVTWKIDAASGELTHVGTYAIGGPTLGRLGINGDGDMITVATNAYPIRVIVWGRDVETGEILNSGEPLAWNDEFQIDSIFV